MAAGGKPTKLTEEEYKDIKSSKVTESRPKEKGKNQC